VDTLKDWSAEVCQPDMSVDNFISSWHDGLGLTILLNLAYKSAGLRVQIPIERYDMKKIEENLDQVFQDFEKLGVPRMLPVDSSLWDKKGVVTYLASIRAICRTT